MFLKNEQLSKIAEETRDLLFHRCEMLIDDIEILNKKIDNPYFKKLIKESTSGGTSLIDYKKFFPDLLKYEENIKAVNPTSLHLYAKLDILLHSKLSLLLCDSINWPEKLKYFAYAESFNVEPDQDLNNFPGWDFLKPLPQSYQKVDDKEVISLGETNIKVLLTPGHTKGAISLIINTTDNNINHMVSIWGGTGLPNTLEENRKYLKSLNYFESFAIENGVDAQISNHPFVNNLLEDMKLLRLRKPREKNPLILTTEEFKRNIDTPLRKSVIEKINSYQ